MALLKSLRRSGSLPESAAQAPSAAVASSPAEAVEAARSQARRRLLGAFVLLGIGVVGFPLVFQTQPRPIPVDLPIEIPRRDHAQPLAAPASAAAPAKATDPSGAAAAGSTPSDPAPKPAARATGAAPATVEVEVVPPPRGDVAKAAESTNPPEGKREEAGREPEKDKDKDKSRFVVQVGAFADAESVREVRAKLERLGLKTYTQSVVIEGAARTRVRVGPFPSRQEALEAQARIKAAGVQQANLLKL